MTKLGFSVNYSEIKNGVIYLIAEASNGSKRESICLSKIMGKKVKVLWCVEHPIPNITEEPVSWKNDLLFLGEPKSHKKILAICELKAGDINAC